MRIASEITATWRNKSDDDDAPESEIMIDGAPSGVVLYGSKLETVLQWGDYYLLFLSDHYLFESTLNIVMLDQALKQIDRAHVTSGGWLTSLKLLEPDMVQFTFFAGTIWTIQLMSKPCLGMPIFGELRYKIWRRWSVLRRFVIHLDPTKLKTRYTSVTTVIDIDVKRINDADYE